MEKAILTFFAFWLGAALGSFANAAAMRADVGKKWWGKERSVCDACGRALSARDLVPLLSFVALGGRCRSCGAKIPPRHFFAEIVGAALLSLLAWRFGPAPAFLFAAAALPFAAFHSLTDLYTGYIYDSWAIAMAVCGLVMRLPHGLSAVVDGALGAAAGFAVIGAIIIVSRGKMGVGDAMLMLGIGAFMGLKMTLISLYLGFLAGGAVVLPLLAAKRVTRKSAIPLGPFLCAGMFFSMLFGGAMLYFLGYAASWPWI